MFKDKAYKKIDILLEITWLVIIFLVPAFFLRSLYNSFEVPKALLFRSLTEFLFFLYVLKIIFYGLPSFKYFKKRLKYFIPAFIFIFFIILTTIFANSPWFSFLGGWQRLVGAFSWIHFLIFSIILFLNLNKARIKRIFKAITISSFFISIYGIIQFLGLDPFIWTYKISKMKRIFSTIGQPNFLGSWLIIAFPAVIITLIKAKKWFKYFAFLNLFLMLIALILTKSRGAMVGILAMFIFFFFFYGLKKNKKISIIVLLVIILLVSFLVYLNLDSNNNSDGGSGFLSRLKSFSNLKRVGKYRLMHWQMAIDLIKKQPLLGYGIANQRFFIAKHYQPEFAIYEAPNIFLDHFHNDVLDMIFSLGIIGFLAYFIFLLSTFVLGLKYVFKRKENSLLILLLLAGIFGYWVSILFSFHITSALILFWGYLAIILFLTNSFDNFNFKFNFNSNRVKVLLSIFILLLFILIFWVFNAKWFLSSAYLFKAQKSKFNASLSPAIKYHNKSIDFSPHYPLFKQEFGLSMYQLVNALTWNRNNKEIKLNLINQGLKQLKNIPKSLTTIESRIWLPQLLSEKANLTQKQKDFKKAEKAFEKVVNFSPKIALVYNNWCQLAIYKKDWVKAENLCKKALSLYPDISHPHINQSHQKMVVIESFPVYDNLIKVYKNQSQYEKALNIAKKMEDRLNQVFNSVNSKFLYVYSLFSNLYNKKGNQQKADFYKNKIQSLTKQNK